MEQSKPKVIILAGPNGAGKTTLAREFLPNEGGVVQFINADLIAAGLSPFAPDTAAVAAGRVMLRRIDEMVSQRLDFAIETTLSGNWLVHHINEWKSKGYLVHLYYVKLATPEHAIARVANRVSKGGHSIPDDVVRRRFHRSTLLFERKYKGIVDNWVMYDNTGDKPRLIDAKEDES